MMVAVLLASCVAVLGPKILAHDVAQAVPAFAPADPDAVIGFTPAPAVQRVMHASELRQLLRKLGYATDASLPDVCFVRSSSPLQEGDVTTAMRKTLGTGATVEIVELSKPAVPRGELVFPRDQIGAPPIALWHGYVLYDENSKFPVWARARISVPSTRLVAQDELRPGMTIREPQVKMVKENLFPENRITPDSVAEGVGCIPRRLIPAQTPVWKDAIDPPLVIVRGDKVTVAVHAGRAQLTLVAEAESNGRRGDLIPLKNLESGKTFRARVEASGKAAVDGDAGKP